MQERSTGSIDRAHPRQVEGLEVILHALTVIGVGTEKAAPPVADTDDVVTLMDDSIDDCLDAGVQARDVAASGEDANTHELAPPIPMRLRRR